MTAAAKQQSLPAAQKGTLFRKERAFVEDRRQEREWLVAAQKGGPDRKGPRGGWGSVPTARRAAARKAFDRKVPSSLRNP